MRYIKRRGGPANRRWRSHKRPNLPDRKGFIRQSALCTVFVRVGSSIGPSLLSSCLRLMICKELVKGGKL